MIVVDETEPVDEVEPAFEPRDITLKVQEDVRDYFDMKKEIGRGRFGTVFLCNCKKTGVKFAAKFINTKRNIERKNVEREIEIMKTLHERKPNPKLIQLYDAFDMKTEMCLILEVVDGGELFERVINDDFVLSERACVVIVKQILYAVEFIHSKNILHLDMKPENILCLSLQGNRVKICDFGLARKYDPRKKLQVLFGTPEFVAPEVVNFEPISFGTDMWSVGVICYVLLSGLSPFMGHNFVETMTNVTKNNYDFDDDAFDEVSDQAIDFIQKLLILDKSERLTPAQCLRHDWIRKPLQPIMRPRRRQSSTDVSSDEESSEVEESLIDSVSEDKTDDLFNIPRSDIDEGKKRKISEDVLEKDKATIDKKRKDDTDNSLLEDCTLNSIDEKMSTCSLPSECMSLHKTRSSADIIEENEISENENNASVVQPSDDIISISKPQTETIVAGCSEALKESNDTFKEFVEIESNILTEKKLDERREMKPEFKDIEKNEITTSHIDIPISHEPIEDKKDIVICENRTEHSNFTENNSKKTIGRFPLVYVTTSQPSPTPISKGDDKSLATTLTNLSDNMFVMNGQPIASNTNDEITPVEENMKSNLPNSSRNEIVALNVDTITKASSVHEPVSVRLKENSIPNLEKQTPLSNERIIPIAFDSNDFDDKPSSHNNDEAKNNAIKPEVRSRVIPIKFEDESPTQLEMKHEKLGQSLNLQTIGTSKQNDISISKMPINESRHKEFICSKDDKTTIPQSNKSDTSNVKKKKEDEVKINAKRDLSSDEMELDKTKKQLKEFVERWNSSQDSSYAIGIPIKSIEENLVTQQSDSSGRLDNVLIYEHPNSNVAQSKIAKELEDKLNELKELERRCENLERKCAKSNETNATKRFRNPDTNVIDKERSTTNLSRRESGRRRKDQEPRVRKRSTAKMENENYDIKPSNINITGTKLPPGRDVPMPSSPISPISPVDITRRVENISISDNREGSPVHRSRTSGRHRPTRDVVSKSPVDKIISIPISYESIFGTKESKEKSASPNRHIRKSSKERSSRPASRAHSKESIYSNSGKSHRRPSRDAPLISTQNERLGTLNTTGCEIMESTDQNIIWPDIRVVPQDDTIEIENDENDEESSPPIPITFKLELPFQKPNKGVTENSANDIPKLIQESTTNSKVDTKDDNLNRVSPVDRIQTQENSQFNRNVMTPENSSKNLPNDGSNMVNQAYVPENKLVAWIMDLGIPQKRSPLSGSTTDLVNHFEGREVSPNKDREKSPLRRDRSPLPSDKPKEKNIIPPKPPFSFPLTREKSFTGINSEEKSEVIQTPWGTLRRSSSRNSINKSPSKQSLNTSPTSTSLVRNPCHEVPVIKTDEKCENGSNKSISINEDKNATAPNSRSSSPRSFKPYNRKSLTTKGLMDQCPVQSSANNGSELKRSPSPSTKVLNVPRARLNLPTPSHNGIQSKEIQVNDTDTSESSFEKKLNKQTSLEVLHDTVKRDSLYKSNPSNFNISTEQKFNSLPRQKAAKEISQVYNLSLNKPEAGDSRGNNIDVTHADSHEKRKSRPISVVPIPPRKQFSFLLFSTHDRISQFEQKDNKSVRTQRPISRSKTTTNFTNNSSSTPKHISPLQPSPSMSSNKSLRDDKISSARPSIVSSKSPLFPTLVEDDIAHHPAKPNSINYPPCSQSFANSVISNDNQSSSIQSLQSNYKPPLSVPSKPIRNMHVGFMRERFQEKQNQIKNAYPFHLSTNIRRITPNNENNANKENSEFRKRILSAGSIL